MAYEDSHQHKNTLCVQMLTLIAESRRLTSAMTPLNFVILDGTYPPLSSGSLPTVSAPLSIPPVSLPPLLTVVDASVLIEILVFTRERRLNLVEYLVVEVVLVKAGRECAEDSVTLCSGMVGCLELVVAW